MNATSRPTRVAPRVRGALRVPVALVAPGLAALSPEAATYVTRVHRLGVGASFIAFDPERAVEAEAELVEVTRVSAVARVGAIRPALVRPARRVTIVQAVAKGEKMDAIIRDATELGATRIAPVTTDRSVARPDAARVERWKRIAVEAARQCGRGDVPGIDMPAKLSAVVSKLAPQDGEAAFCLDPWAGAPLGPALAALRAETPVTFLVGPEGGFEEAEIEAAERVGWQRVTLGALILRTETVCPAVLGALLLSAPASA
jgi:16S rRNA (uracil1498-N3)-methyltransferase